MGFSRKSIARIAAAARAWPGGWTVDLAGDVVTPAVVLIAEAGDRFAPALHLEEDRGSVVVTAVAWDEPVPLGTFAGLEAALSRLTAFVADHAARSGDARLN